MTYWPQASIWFDSDTLLFKDATFSPNPDFNPCPFNTWRLIQCTWVTQAAATGYHLTEAVYYVRCVYNCNFSLQKWVRNYKTFVFWTQRNFTFHKGAISLYYFVFCYNVKQTNNDRNSFYDPCSQYIFMHSNWQIYKSKQMYFDQNPFILYSSDFYQTVAA